VIAVPKPERGRRQDAARLAAEGNACDWAPLKMAIDKLEKDLGKAHVDCRD